MLGLETRSTSVPYVSISDIFLAMERPVAPSPLDLSTPAHGWGEGRGEGQEKHWDIFQNPHVSAPL